jgi:AcrR family transcriptional regulator
MPVKPPRQPYSSRIREAAADETRCRIVAAARALLAGGEGLPAFSVDGVARRAGVTRLTVYNQFDSRCGLLEAVFDDLACQGGMCELPAIFAERDPARALRSFVHVFCRFWANHGVVISRFAAVAKMDEEVACGLHRRTEQRRVALTELVERLVTVPCPQAAAELVDVLFALTSLEMHEALSVNGRGAEAVERLIQGLVEQALHAVSIRLAKSA